MNYGHSLLKAVSTTAFVLTLGMTVSAGASAFGGKTWKEEVKLHDGQVIVEERHVNLGGYLYLDSSERVSLDETATFILRGTNKKIIWKTDFRDSEPEPNSLNLIRFDVVEGTPYIATYPAGCIAYNKWGRPNPPQVLFKYEGDRWKRITVAELPPELIGMPANVIVGAPASSQLKSFYTVEGVNTKNYYISTPEYKTILREPVRSAGQGCPEMIRKGNGGWDGIGWFSDQPSKEACLKYCEQKEVSAQNCPCNRLFKGAK